MEAIEVFWFDLFLWCKTKCQLMQMSKVKVCSTKLKMLKQNTSCACFFFQFFIPFVKFVNRDKEQEVVPLRLCDPGRAYVCVSTSCMRCHNGCMEKRVSLRRQIPIIKPESQPIETQKCVTAYLSFCDF